KKPAEVVLGLVFWGGLGGGENLDETVGLFVNTVPVRIHLSKDKTFSQLLPLIGQQQMASSRYHYTPLADIYNATPLRDKLFDHAVVFENQYQLLNLDEEFLISGLRVEDFAITDPTHFSVSPIFYYSEADLICRIRYDARRYSPEKVKKAGESCLEIIEKVIDHPDVLLRDLTRTKPTAALPAILPLKR
ncbi:MAG: hypothetical protein ICV83_31590, partial [Cytophagales bacterium]|nr:hypothetical protein [Cytophagales bacterium]